MKQEEIVNVIKLFTDYIIFRYKSRNTARTYGSAVTLFLASHPKISRPQEINADEIIQYLLKIDNLSSRRNAHSAIKLFYKFRSKHGESSKFRYIPYPEKPDTIPDHVTIADFIEIMKACENVKHKCILMLAFDCGLRVSEVINLKIIDIDSKQMNIAIRQSKGRKDRILKLTQFTLEYLREYYQLYKPVEYLFNGQSSIQYSIRSCEEILANLCKKTKIKHYKFHALRHGYSMALYESGASLETIRDLLGHSDVKTTQIYAIKNNNIIQKTLSPIEIILSQKQNTIQLQYQ